MPVCVVDWWIREQWAGVVWEMSHVAVVCTVMVVVGHLNRPTKFCVWTRLVIFVLTTMVVVAEMIVLGRHTKAEVIADKSYTGFHCFIPVVYDNSSSSSSSSSSSWLLSVAVCCGLYWEAMSCLWPVSRNSCSYWVCKVHVYIVHVRLIRKHVVDFLLVIIELFSLVITADVLRANIDWKSPFLKG